MSRPRRVTRRNALQLGAAAAALPLVHIRTAGAAGKLKVGFWDHWVPATNDVMRSRSWAGRTKNKVEVAGRLHHLEWLQDPGDPGRRGAGAYRPRLLPFYSWEVQTYADQLEPVDDVIKNMTAQYGKYSQVAEYLASSKGQWMAVPSSTGNPNLTCCARISMLKDLAGIDMKAMYPAAPTDASAAAGWNYDAFLKAAEACHKGNYPFALGLGATCDSVNNTGIIFSAFGAELVNAKGEITVESAAVNEVTGIRP